MLETLQHVYGYVPTLGGPIDLGDSLQWTHVPPTLGFVTDSSFAEIGDQEKAGICLFIHRLLKDHENLPSDRDDLDDRNFMLLSTLFDWQHITRTPAGLFIFHTPASSACEWSLGVNSASIALYVCRLILSNPSAHTILTVAHHLLSRCIPFLTLISLRSTPSDKPLSKSYSPVSFQKEKHKFTKLDFDSAMLHSKATLQSAGGRAAMLHGGILSRIAQEFLSIDGVLEGPSAEVTLHRTGFVTPSESPGYSYWDDGLTEDEIATIIGTYAMYTGIFFFSVLKLFTIQSFFMIGNGQQTTVVSWFPPPSIWESGDCGYAWVEWTERAENIFAEILSDIQTGKGQPLSKAKWRNRLHGHVNNRLVTGNNQKRSEKYLQQKCLLCLC